VGTSVTLVSGAPFPAGLIANTVILINGQAYQTYGQPRSASFLEIDTDAGTQTGVPYVISSPTVAGLPLPYAFGPLEGPFAPVVFALGDNLNAGTLYFTNFSDADSASDLNTLEIAPPSNPLVSGTVWNGLTFAGNKDDFFCIRYSYLTTIGASNSTSYQWSRVPSPSGIWSRWACCACPLGVAFLGRDGIYIGTESTAVNITDEKLYSLFPHEGQSAQPVVLGNITVWPVNMTLFNNLRLSYCDEELRFSYVDNFGNYNTLIYEIYKKRWFLNTYNDAIIYHYLVEAPVIGLGQPEVLMLSISSNAIEIVGGNTDNGVIITSNLLTPAMDGGDVRSQKLYVDTMTQFDGTGTINQRVVFNNNEIATPAISITCSGPVDQALQNIASLADLSLYRNVGALFTWTGGPQGPRLYAWEATLFPQPYLSEFFVTQFSTFSFPGWKHLRRLYPAIISNDPILLTIETQDRRVFGPYTIPSTSGNYRILPQMLYHGIKDLAFSIQLDGQGKKFALFPSDFVCEVKQWNEETYIDLAIFKA
jgi:hypothetical protein